MDFEGWGKSAVVLVGQFKNVELTGSAWHVPMSLPLYGGCWPPSDNCACDSRQSEGRTEEETEAQQTAASLAAE